MDNDGKRWLPDDSEIIEIRKEKDQDRLFNRLFNCWKLLLYITAKNLPRGSTHEDAEDCLSNFLLENLWDIVEKFDSTRGRFAPYLTFCLKRHCWAEGRKITERVNTVVSLTTDIKSSDEQEPFELPVTDDRSENDVQQVVNENELKAGIEDCFEVLDPMDKEICLLSGDGHTSLEIAALLNITPGAVRVRLCRARKKLRACLKKKKLLN